MRRDMIEASGIPVPRARTFPIGGGTDDALAYAESIGYPVVLKPMLNDSTTEVIRGVYDATDLRRAIEYFELVPTERQDFTAASYSVTQVMTPRRAGSRRTRNSYRFMVEEHVRGEYVRLVLLAGELVSVVHAPEGPWTVDTTRDIGDQVHPSVLEVSELIWEAYPGLAVMVADVVVPDFQANWSEQDWYLVELSERPWLYLQHALSRRSANVLADQLLRMEVPDIPVGEQTMDQAGDRAVTFIWEGVSRGPQTCTELAGICSAVGLRGWCEVRDEIDGQVAGHIEGAPELIALVAELAVAGALLQEAIVCADLDLVEHVGMQSFEIR